MTDQQKATFSKYGKSFQEKLCQLILQDRSFCDQIQEVLNINFLELKYLQIFVQKIFDYKEKYKVHPSYSTMTTILRSDLEEESEAVQKQARDFFVRISKTEFEVDGAEYVKETALDFCKKQKLKEAMIKSVKLLQNSSFDEISEVINEALKLGSDNDHGYDYVKDFEERFLFKSRNPISTGWGPVDDICKSGLGQGELGVVIAPTGAGKSMALVHFGTKAIEAGKTVIHYTLELAATVVASRYDSCLTGIPLGDLIAFKEKIYDSIQELGGTLIVKEYSTKSASTATIINHLNRLKQRGINPDLIIVDYGDLLKPTIVRKEKRHELETIYEALRAIAQDFKCPVWTASQTNRAGLNAELITMESISEAFNKCFVADLICTISRTIQDKTTNTGRFFVAKNRNGPDGLVFPMIMDTSSVTLRVLPHTGETANDVITKGIKEQKEELKKKYKEFRGNK